MNNLSIPSFKYKNISIIFAAVFLLLLTACQDNEVQKNFYAGRTQGSTFHITYFGGDVARIERGIDSIYLAVNQSMSTYIETSDISKINNGDSTVVVDNLFIDVFKASKHIHKQSKGYFDPTVGVLVNYYGFGPEKYTMKIDTSYVDSLMQYVGLNKLKLTPEHRLKMSHPGIYIDFNAIAQGYTADRVAALLDQNNIDNYLVEVGGEIVVKGKNLESQEPWMIGIDDPNQTLEKRTLTAIITLKDHGMATSGNYRKFRIDSVTGKKYVHTIDPLTGYPARNSLLSATVLAENAMMADGYATTLMTMGIEKSKEFLKTIPENLEAYLIYAENDSIRYFMTDGFEDLLVKD